MLPVCRVIRYVSDTVILFSAEQFGYVVSTAGCLDHIFKNVDNDAFLAVLIFDRLTYCKYFVAPFLFPYYEYSIPEIVPMVKPPKIRG